MRNWLFLLISCAAAVQAGPPAQVEIAYELTRNGASMAEIVERLVHANGSYQLTETWKGKGLYALLGRAKRSSHGSLVPEGLRPLEFVDERTGRDTARAWFDWKANTFTMRYKGASKTEPMPANAQDSLSSLLTLSFSPPAAQPLTMHVINGRGISRHVYQANGQERVAVPAGEFESLKLMREKDNGRAEIWLATGHGYLPVRVLVLENDGTRYEQVATRITIP